MSLHRSSKLCATDATWKVRDAVRSRMEQQGRGAYQDSPPLVIGSDYRNAKINPMRPDLFGDRLLRCDNKSGGCGTS